MGQGIRFLLNGEEVNVPSPPPTLTLLDWLRARGLTGAKEGCREGDCGACTVALGEAVDGRLRVRAVNACLVFLPMVDGRLVITAEGLAEGRELHPVQRALVERHGSQCGFCTPGMVMSLFALYHAQEPEASLHEALAGNLCRCTGYRPILEAAVAAAQGPADDRLARTAAEMVRRLEALRREDTLTLDGFAAPRTLAALLELLARQPEAHLLAGGTDLGLFVTKQYRSLPAVIAVDRVPELRHIEETAEGVILGGAVTYTEALPALERLHPAVGGLVRRIGSRQIRNLGTLGGNIANASPIGDSLPPLIALGASVRLAACGGTREVAVEDFLLGYRKTDLMPGEVIEAIVIPRPPQAAHLAAFKVAKRFDQDISTLSAAFLLTVRDGRVTALRAAFGGMAAVAKRAPALEAALTGQPWREDTLALAQPALKADFTPLSDVRGSADYRLSAAEGLMRRLFWQTTRPDLALEVMAL